MTSAAYVRRTGPWLHRHHVAGGLRFGPIGLRDLFGRRAPQPTEIVLCGFTTGIDPDHPRPMWEPDDIFDTVDAATAAARSWIEATGPQAEVEVIETAGNQGHVVRVVTAAGHEDIAEN